MTEAEQYTNGTATEDEDANKVRPADIEAVSHAKKKCFSIKNIKIDAMFSTESEFWYAKVFLFYVS